MDVNQRVYVRAGTRLLSRLLPDGTLDGSYAGVFTGASATITGIQLDSQSRIVLFGTLAQGGWIGRLTTAGDPDPAFGGAGNG